MPAEPRAPAQPAHVPVERLVVLAEHDVPPPAAEAGLHHERRCELAVQAVAEVPGGGMGHARGGEPLGGDELVVRGEQGAARVEHVSAPRLEPVEIAEAVVDPVERRRHVQPREDHVARADAAARGRRLHEPRLDAGPSEGGEEAGIRRRQGSGDEEDTHGGREASPSTLSAT